MKIFAYVFGVLFVATGAYAVCCDSYDDLRTIYNDCHKELIRNPGDSSLSLCRGLICLTNQWGVMENGKLIKEKIETLVEKIFPDASEKLKSNLMMCVEKANTETTECTTLATINDCLAGGEGNLREINQLTWKREQKQ